MVKRFEIYLFNLDEDPAAEAKNTRPCIVVSPDEMNEHIDTVIIAPVSAATADYPTRIALEFLNSRRAVVLDQIQTVDRRRLAKKIGEADAETGRRILETMQEMFAR